MNNLFYYYYNLNNVKYNEYKNVIAFKYNYDDYFFVPLNRPKEDLSELYNITIELLNKKTPCHKFILNNRNSLITEYKSKEYVLLKTNKKYNDEVNLFDINNNMNKLILNSQNNKLYRNNWGKLWEDKVDYFEYQISKLGKNKKIILNSFSYYIGLAENAISYVNETYKKYFNNEKLTLSHKRLFSPNYSLNYYNPLSFIFDYKSRDIGEYIKMSFFNDDITIEEIENFLAKQNLTNFEANLLIARLLYPSYYFDIYEQVMNNNAKEDNLINVIDKSQKYEKLLNKIYYFLNKKNPLIYIEWIFKDQQ